MHSFSSIYNELFDYIYGYLFIRVKDQQIAEDLTSKVFLTAFEKRHQHQEEKGSWKQWLTGIAKNNLLNYWRSEKVSFPLEELENAEVILKSSEEIGTLHQKIDFEKLMDSLPENIRRLLILRYIDDFTYEDIAGITNKTPAAIRKVFSRLHKQLAIQFGG